MGRMFSWLRQSCGQKYVNLRQAWHDGGYSQRMKAHARLLILLTILGAASCLLIQSISHNAPVDPEFAGWQLLWLVCGLLALLLCFLLPVEYIQRFLIVALPIAYVLLWGVLLLGERTYGAVRWYRFHGLCMQPSELAKPAFLLVFAWCWHKTREWSQWSRLAAIGVMTILWMLPIACQPDWGTTMIYAATALLILYGLGMSWRQMMAPLAAGAGVIIWVICRYPYVQRRVLAFLGWGGEQMAGASWQAVQMHKCLVKGGWSGILFSAPNDRLMVPFPYNDSIFAAAAEMLGVIGVLPLLLLCLGWMGYCCYLASQNAARWTYPIYLGAGVMLTGQAFVHLGVNLGLLPTTGINLPLVSYGGSSLLATILIIGMVERCAWEDKITIKAE